MPEGSRKKRTRHEIVVEISRKAKRGAKKTRMMYNCSLTHFQIERYLGALEKAGFIAENSGVWKTTEKGLHVIEACELCQNLLETA